MNSFRFLLLAFFLFACSGTETIIQDKKIEITVPQIKDSISANYINVPDSVVTVLQSLPDSARFEGVKEIITAKGDKVKVYLNYKPKTGQFFVDIPEYSVDTTITDTTAITIKKQVTAAEKFGYVFWGGIGALVLGIIGFVFFKYWRR